MDTCEERFIAAILKRPVNQYIYNIHKDLNINMYE
jgi:hypothetical protein